MASSQKFILKETISIKRLKALIESGHLETEDIKKLKDYLKKHDGDGKINVSYSQRLDMGRQYAEKSLSLQCFSKRIRHTLVHNTHIDVDIVNCHPVILCQYCEKNKINCDLLKDYIENREERLKNIMDVCGCDRDKAKALILSTLYLGVPSDYCIREGISNPYPDWVDEFSAELNKIAIFVKSINPEVYKKIEKSRDKEISKNKDSSCLSYVCQDIENNLIMTAFRKFSDMGFCVETLCFDGLLLLKEDTEITPDVLSEVSVYCQRNTGYKVDFETKPMKPHYNISEQATDFSDYKHPPETLRQYDQIYASSLIQNSPQDEYKLKTHYIEQFVCKIQFPQPMFAVSNPESTKNKIIFLNQSDCATLFEPISVGFDGPNGPVPWFRLWAKDPNQRVYAGYNFIPYNKDLNNHECPPNILNTFEGFNPDIYGEQIPLEQRDKLIKPYKDLACQLCGGSEEDASYFHRFIADIFQNPDKKPPVSIIFKGVQGTGKNMILDAIGAMIGPTPTTHYITSSDPNDFYGTHAEGYAQKLLVNLNEAEGKKTYDFEGKMKSYITEDTIVINPKHLRPHTIKNVARTIITTNKPNPISIDVTSSDRRYVAYGTTDVYTKKSSKFWTELYRHLRKPLVRRALYQWFMSFNNENFDWIKKRPFTSTYEEMRQSQVPKEALYFDDLYMKNAWHTLLNVQGGEQEPVSEEEEDDGVSLTKPVKKFNNDDVVELPILNLYVGFQNFVKKYKFAGEEGYKISSHSFISRLIDTLQYPVSRGRTSTNRTVKFIPEQLHRHSVYTKKWIGGYETEIAECSDAGKEDAEEDYFNCD